MSASAFGSSNWYLIPSPMGHHVWYHMSEWPWWPGPMHIAYPLLFFAAIAVVAIVLWRKS